MCGTGRFLLPIKQKGYDIHGFDASSQMLAILKQKAKEQSLAPNIWEQFIEERKTDKLYNLIFIPSGSFGLLVDDEKINMSLERIYHQLEQGGKFVFEVETHRAAPEDCGVWHGDVRYINSDSYIMLSTLHLSPQDDIGTVICRYELVESGRLVKAEIEKMQIKMYSPGELIPKLKKMVFLK